MGRDEYCSMPPLSYPLLSMFKGRGVEGSGGVEWVKLFLVGVVSKALWDGSLPPVLTVGFVDEETSNRNLHLKEGKPLNRFLSTPVRRDSSGISLP